jgi:hypothetical protein
MGARIITQFSAEDDAPARTILQNASDHLAG